MNASAPRRRGPLLRATGLLMVLGLTGKALGLFVQIQTARYLGVDPSLDAYVVAQTLPELLVQLFLLGTLAQMLVPTLADQSHAHGEARAAVFSGRVLGFLLIAVIGLSLLAGGLAGPIMSVMAPGFQADRHALAVRLFRLLILNIGTGTLIYFAKALLQLRKRFVLAASSAVVASLVQCVLVMLLAPKQGVVGLTIAAVGLNLVTLVILFAGLAGQGAWLVPRAPVWEPEFTRLLRLTGVVGVFSLASIVSFATDRWFASLLAPGSLAILGYAWRFEPIFLVVISGAVATPIYTEMSEAAARQDAPAFQTALVRGLKLLLLVVLPAAALLIGLARPLVTLLLRRGAFDAASARSVADVLAILSVAFVGWSVSALLVQALNARRQPRLSLIFGLVSALLNFLLDALFYRPFGVAGLALATTVVTIPMTVLFTRLVLRQVGVTGQRGLLAFVGGVGLFALAAGAAARLTQVRLEGFTPLVQLLGGGLAGLIPLALGLVWWQPPELRDFRRP